MEGASREYDLDVSVRTILVPLDSGYRLLLTETALEQLMNAMSSDVAFIVTPATSIATGRKGRIRSRFDSRVPRIITTFRHAR